MSNASLQYEGRLPVFAGAIIVDSDLTRLLGKRIRFGYMSHTNNGVPIDHEAEVVGWCRNRQNDPCLVVQETCDTVEGRRLYLRIISLFETSVDVRQVESAPNAGPGATVPDLYAELKRKSARVEDLETFARKCLDGVPPGRNDRAGLLALLADIESDALDVLRANRSEQTKKSE